MIKNGSLAQFIFAWHCNVNSTSTNYRQTYIRNRDGDEEADTSSDANGDADGDEGDAGGERYLNHKDIISRLILDVIIQIQFLFSI